MLNPMLTEVTLNPIADSILALLAREGDVRARLHARAAGNVHDASGELAARLGPAVSPEAIVPAPRHVAGRASPLADPRER